MKFPRIPLGFAFPTLLVLAIHLSVELSVAQVSDSSTESPDKNAVAQADEFTLVDPPAVKRIVMFNSGLTQIVHEGELTGNCRVEMKFSGHDVDDVLKSLVFEDQGGVRCALSNISPRLIVRTLLHRILAHP